MSRQFTSSFDCVITSRDNFHAPVIKHLDTCIGGDVNKQDNFGRTPLHVAVSVDFAEMADFLLKNNANIDARTSGELQAPIHYAAKNGTTKSLKLLLGYQANIDSLDYRQRTPLQVR